MRVFQMFQFWRTSSAVERECVCVCLAGQHRLFSGVLECARFRVGFSAEHYLDGGPLEGRDGAPSGVRARASGGGRVIVQPITGSARKMAAEAFAECQCIHVCRSFSLHS